jgi:hypothetical protein
MLSAKQRKAALALSRGATALEAGESVSVSRRTIVRWRTDTSFLAACSGRKAEVVTTVGPAPPRPGAARREPEPEPEIEERSAVWHYAGKVIGSRIRSDLHELGDRGTVSLNFTDNPATAAAVLASLRAGEAPPP